MARNSGSKPPKTTKYKKLEKEFSKFCGFPVEVEDFGVVTQKHYSGNYKAFKFIVTTKDSKKCGHGYVEITIDYELIKCFGEAGRSEENFIIMESEPYLEALKQLCFSEKGE